MTQYNMLNIKLIKFNLIDNSNDGTNFTHKLLLIHKFQTFVKLLQIVYQLV